MMDDKMLQIIKNWVTRTQLKLRGIGTTERYVVPAPLVTPVMLLLNNTNTLLSGNHGRHHNMELKNDDILL